MGNIWKWRLGFALACIVLLILPFALIFFLPNRGYQMMGYGYGTHMPMIYGGYGMMDFGMFFMWLNSLASLGLIGLGIAWLVKALSVKK